MTSSFKKIIKDAKTSLNRKLLQPRKIRTKLFFNLLIYSNDVSLFEMYLK